MSKNSSIHARSFVADLATLSLLLLFIPGSFAADAGAINAGAIQQLTGDVTITGADNVARKAVAKENIRSGDMVQTEAKSELLVRMTDGTTVALRPNTRFQFAEFKYEKRPDDSMLTRVLSGSARFITGLIGRNNRSSFRVGTTTATIGIRGTDFEVAVVPEDTPDTRAGVYDYVRDGSTDIQLVSGQALTVAKEQTAFAPDKPRPGEEPLQILRERPIFLQAGGGLDALIQSITITPMVIPPVFR